MTPASRLLIAQEFHFHVVPKLPDYLVSREAYRKHRHNYTMSQAGYPRKCPCPICGGEGRYYRQEDNDPVEGFKMADKKLCQSCKGAGEQDPEVFWRYFQEYRGAALLAIKRHKEIRHTQEEMIRLLKGTYTPEQMRRAGFHNPKGLKKK